jgi:dTDP-glucose pyrophosphorylase
LRAKFITPRISSNKFYIKAEPFIWITIHLLQNGLKGVVVISNNGATVKIKSTSGMMESWAVCDEYAQQMGIKLKFATFKNRWTKSQMILEGVERRKK